MSAATEPVAAAGTTEHPQSAAPRRIGVSLSNETPVAETVEFVRSAEELGLAEAWIPESGHGRGVFTVATAVAAATSHIGIGIGVVNPFWRHPSLIAMEAAALDEFSGGRLRLGIGAALWTLRALGEDDERTARPLAATSEAIATVRSLLANQSPPAAPEIFVGRADARLDVETRGDIPVYVGAVNQRMLQASGALADGVQLGAITSPGYTRWAWGQVAAGAVAAERDPVSIDLAGNVLVSVDTDRRAARRATHRVLAYYLHRVEGVVITESGADPEQVDQVRQRVISEGIEAGEQLIDDTLVDIFAAAGDPDEVTERLHVYAAAGLRGVLAWHVFGPDRGAGLRLLASDVLAHIAVDRVDA